MAAFKIEVDGNDGTGKSTLIKYLESKFSQCTFSDRGLFSKFTLKEDVKDFREIVKTSGKYYIILKSSIEASQNRILKRGDSLEERFHTKEDLSKYNDKFKSLVALCKGLSNVIEIDTSINDISLMCDKASNIIKDIICNKGANL